MALNLPADLTVETKLFPPMQVDLTGQRPPSTSSQAAAVVTALALKLIKPKVTVRVAGATVVQWAPAGEPGPNHWHTTRVVLLVALGLVAFKLVRIIL